MSRCVERTPSKACVFWTHNLQKPRARFAVPNWERQHVGASKQALQRTARSMPPEPLCYSKSNMHGCRPRLEDPTATTLSLKWQWQSWQRARQHHPQAPPLCSSTGRCTPAQHTRAAGRRPGAAHINNEKKRQHRLQRRVHSSPLPPPRRAPLPRPARHGPWGAARRSARAHASRTRLLNACCAAGVCRSSS